MGPCSTQLHRPACAKTLLDDLRLGDQVVHLCSDGSGVIVPNSVQHLAAVVDGLIKPLLDCLGVVDVHTSICSSDCESRLLVEVDWLEEEPRIFC